MTDTQEHVSTGQTQLSANQVLVLGGGLTVDRDRIVQLHPRSSQRVERTVSYYEANAGHFENDYGVIVCTGGYTGPDVFADDFGDYSEARLMAEALVQAGVPAKLIETETKSTNTLSNLLNVAEQELIDFEDITDENPLGVVSSPNHIERFLWYTSRFGISIDYVQKIPTEHTDSAFKEFLKSRRDNLILLGARSPEEMRAREQFASRAATRAKECGKKVLSFI